MIKVPINFLSSEICHKVLLEVIDQLKNGRKHRRMLITVMINFVTLCIRNGNILCRKKGCGKEEVLKCKDQTKRRVLQNEFKCCLGE